MEQYLHRNSKLVIRRSFLLRGKKAQKVKIVLHDFRVLPLLSFVGIYPESL